VVIDRRMRPPITITTITSMPALAVVLIAVLAASGASAATPTADYEVVFEATWSAGTHPIDFPPSPHFSGLIGGTHNDLVSFWDVGSLASAGIKSMAELGNKLALTNEVSTAIGAGTANAVVSGGGISPSPGTVSLNFTATEDFPLLTLVAMVAPSPDWFVGVSSLDLMAGAKWRNKIVVQLGVYDAGTDSGVTFTSPNAATMPPIPMAVFATGPFAPPMQYGSPAAC